MSTRAVPIILTLAMTLTIGAPMPLHADDQGGEAAERLAEGDRLFKTRERERALVVYLEAAEAARAEGSKDVLVEALAQAARMHSFEKERLGEARKLLTAAEAEASAEEPNGWSRLLGVRGIIEREEGDRDRAKKTFIEMYDYCTERKLHRRAIDAAHHVALVGSPEEQVAWAKKGIVAAEAAGDRRWLAVLWNNLGWTHEDAGRYDESVAAYRKARELHHETGDDHAKLLADWALGHALRLAGEGDEAKRLLEPTLATARKRHAELDTKTTHEWLGYALQEVGELRVLEGKRAEGLELLGKARTALEAVGMREHWPEAMTKLDARIEELKAAD